MSWKLAASIALLCVLSACGGSGSSGGDGNKNRAPTIEGTPTFSVNAGERYAFTPSATDADADPLSYSIQNQPAWATFDASSGALSGQPEVADIGGYDDIVITVSDGQGHAVSLPAFSLSVVPVVTALEAKSMNTTNSAFAASTLDMSVYSAVTLLSDADLDASGQSDTEFMGDAKGQSLFILDEDDNPIAIAYFTKSQIASGNADITVESIANGLIMSNPLLIGYGSDDRESILAHILTTSEYTAYVAYLKTVIAASPTQLLDEDRYPKVIEDSITLIVDAIDALGGNSKQVLRTVFHSAPREYVAKEGNGIPGPVLGKDNEPYLADVAGSHVLAINPTMVFYGIEINKERTRLIAGKDAAFALVFKEASKSVRKEVYLGDGQHRWRYVKNDFGSRAGTMSGVANILKTICLIIDLKATCPISNATIAAVVEPQDSMSGQVLDAYAGLGKDLFTNLITGPKYYEKVAKYLASDKGNVVLGHATRILFHGINKPDSAVKAFKGGKRFFKAAAKHIGKVIKVYGIGQKFLPYTYDLVTTPKRVGWCLTQSRGVLASTPTCSEQAPVASFSINASVGGYVNDSVGLDASSSTDPIFESTSLQYQWDFDGDGNIDAPWSTSSNASTSYSKPGVYRIVLYIRTPDGREGSFQKEIVVRDDSDQCALLIKGSNVSQVNPAANTRYSDIVMTGNIVDSNFSWSDLSLVDGDETTGHIYLMVDDADVSGGPFPDAWNWSALDRVTLRVRKQEEVGGGVRREASIHFGGHAKERDTSFYQVNARYVSSDISESQFEALGSAIRDNDAKTFMMLFKQTNAEFSSFNTYFYPQTPGGWTYHWNSTLAAFDITLDRCSF